MEYKQCARCVMDNASDSTITFDEQGYCNYCTNALRRMPVTYFPNEEGQKKLGDLIEKIKSEGSDKKYDCIMGISGGLDSSYLAYLGSTQWELRILGIHVDDGFDTLVTKQNIKNLCNKGNITLKTIKPDPNEFKDLTRAFMFGSVPNIAMPQDNVIFSYLYQEAHKTGVKNFLSGGNFSLENILEQGNTHGAFDVVNIKDIHRKYGTIPINDIPLLSLFKKGIISKYILKTQTYLPLDYINYNRQNAIQELSDFCGFEYYGSKHLENHLTEFAQLYWFPKKFGVDKRKSHLSSMIISGQLSREEALAELGKPLYEDERMKDVIESVKKELAITDEEFESIMRERPKQHSEYKTSLFNKITTKYYFQRR